VSAAIKTRIIAAFEKVVAKQQADKYASFFMTWMDKTYDPVIVLEASPVRHSDIKSIDDPEREARLRREAAVAVKPWHGDLPKVPWTPTPDRLWDEREWDKECAEIQARKFERERQQARDEHIKPWEPWCVVPLRRSGIIPRRVEYGSGMEPFIGREARAVTDMLIFEYAATEIPFHDRVPFKAGSKKNRERIQAELHTRIRYYNGPPCRPCMRKFGGKPPVTGKTLSKDHGCESCGINDAHLDYGMLPNDVTVANKNRQHWFRQIVKRLGSTLFDGTVTAPKPKAKWGNAEALRVIAARLEHHGLTTQGGLGSVTYGENSTQPSALITYVGSSGWEMDHLVHGTGRLLSNGYGQYSSVVAKDSERVKVKADVADWQEARGIDAVDQDDWTEEDDLIPEPSEDDPVEDEGASETQAD
jgi:hypothetical protein